MSEVKKNKNFFLKLLREGLVPELIDGGRDRQCQTKVWRTVFEKQGLHQTAHILENYGIGSETEVSELDQDDLSKLESQTRTLVVECLHRGGRGGMGEEVGRMIVV